MPRWPVAACGASLPLCPDPSTEHRGGLLSREASFLVLDMLRDVVRPDPPTRDRTDRQTIAWKTGTSFGFRDAWSVGIVGHHVLAVWVGNFDGSANPALVGREAAAPLFFAIADSLAGYNPQGEFATAASSGEVEAQRNGRPLVGGQRRRRRSESEAGGCLCDHRRPARTALSAHDAFPGSSPAFRRSRFPRSTGRSTSTLGPVCEVARGMPTRSGSSTSSGHRTCTRCSDGPASPFAGRLPGRRNAVWTRPRRRERHRAFVLRNGLSSTTPPRRMPSRETCCSPPLSTAMRKGCIGSWITVWWRAPRPARTTSGRRDRGDSRFAWWMTWAVPPLSRSGSGPSRASAT